MSQFGNNRGRTALDRYNDRQAAASQPGESRLAQSQAGGSGNAAAATERLTYTIIQDDTPERCFAGRTETFSSIEIYAAKALSGGVLTANDNDVYIGRHLAVLPQRRAAGDSESPVLYESQTGKEFLLSDICVRGKAGDGLVMVYYQ